MGRLPIASSTSTTVMIDGREMIAFGGCDYLSLAHHPRVHLALESGVREFGLSAGASRETTGNTVAHEQLEEELAKFLGTEAALLTPDGYLSNLIAMQGLSNSIESVLVDHESHVSMSDALRATGRRAVTYPLTDAKRAAEIARDLHRDSFAIATDGVFPVLGKLAPLRELLSILPANGVLIVDDSHGTGVFGKRGRGTVELAGLVDPRIVITGTLSKALGCFGGFVAGTRAFLGRVRESSHAYVGSTPIPPAIARAASAALRVVDHEPERRARLVELAKPLRETLATIRRPVPPGGFPVFTLTDPSPGWAEFARKTFLEEGLLVPLVLYPDGLGYYFRIALRADHTPEQVQLLVGCLGMQILR